MNRNFKAVEESSLNFKHLNLINGTTTTLDKLNQCSLNPDSKDF